MPTYGKKKKSILPSLTNIRDSISSPARKKTIEVAQRSSRQALLSSRSGPILTKINGDDTRKLGRSDSIDELASMLLEDTDMDNQPEFEKSKRTPRLTSSTTVSTLATISSDYDKPLPAPPDGNSDVHGNFQEQKHLGRIHASLRTELRTTDFSARFVQSMVDEASPRTQHDRTSLPPLPRRSSKRAPQLQPQDHGKAAPGSRADMHTERFIKSSADASSFTSEVYHQSSQRSEPNTTSQTSRHRKTRFEEHVDDNAVTSKSMKPRKNGSKVVGRVKNAINDRFTRNHHDSTQKHHLLDDSTKDQDGDDNSHDISHDSESKMHTKPIKRRKQALPSTVSKPDHDTRQCSGGIQRFALDTEEVFGLQLERQSTKRGTTEHESKQRPRAPLMTDVTYSEGLSVDINTVAQNQNNEARSVSNTDSYDTHSQSQTPRKRLKHTKKTSNLIFEADFDACFSSSPFDSSTPRLRLEPVDENSKKTLRNVSASSPSLFDSAAVDTDMEDFDDKIDSPRIPSRHWVKKHPSPSKMELEELEQAMGRLNGFRQPAKYKQHHIHGEKQLTNRLAPAILGQIDANVGRRVNDMSSNRSPVIHKSAIPRPSLPSERTFARSKGRFPVRPTLLKPSTAGQMNRQEHDAMDVDELQWDDSAYNIGGKHS